MAKGYNPPQFLSSPPRHVQKVGNKYRLYTDSPSELVVTLVSHTSALGLKIVSLNILAPSLEDAFVSLTEKEAERA